MYDGANCDTHFDHMVVLTPCSDSTQISVSWALISVDLNHHGTFRNICLVRELTEAASVTYVQVTADIIINAIHRANGPTNYS